MNGAAQVDYSKDNSQV